MVSEMNVAYSAPKTVREIAAVFLCLSTSRDQMLPARVSYWVDRLGDQPLADLSPDDVDAILAELETVPGENGRLKSGSTINRYRMAMQAVIKFARQKRLLPRGWVSPFADIPQHKENPGRVRFLTEDEERRLMDAARLQTWVLLPLLIRLAIVTGLRRGALLGLRWADLVLDADDPHVVVARTKNGDEHHSPLTPNLVEALEAFRRVGFRADDLIFTGKDLSKPHDFRHGFVEARKLAGLGPDVTFHTLRHTSCSRLAAAGKDILEIATHAGHRSLSMTKRYSHLSIKGRAKTIKEVFGNESTYR